MKTQNKNKKMEDTKMKTKILTLALILGFVLATISTSAYGKKVNVKAKAAVEDAINSINFEIIEEELEIEDWMFDLLKTVQNEEELAIEDWMSNEMGSGLLLSEVEEEEELEIEGWMTETFQNNDEPELEIEDWMVQF